MIMVEDTVIEDLIIDDFQMVSKEFENAKKDD